ncbi:hypothetical protein BXZ70DRAFT_909626 [Cristinia sonorae]|uniref:Uncharacterized protein n=1 Tax=Cristinia sonorae TaxID=1940300 RepID=A0A8K0UIC7_9AGAR|nr:hypothetical protein BXZ70DRAFT_909626 [Cristinia sonorae]
MSSSVTLRIEGQFDGTIAFALAVCSVNRFVQLLKLRSSHGTVEASVSNSATNNDPSPHHYRQVLQRAAPVSVDELHQVTLSGQFNQDLDRNNSVPKHPLSDDDCEDVSTSDNDSIVEVEPPIVKAEAVPEYIMVHDSDEETSISDSDLDQRGEADDKGDHRNATAMRMARVALARGWTPPRRHSTADSATEYATCCTSQSELDEEENN